MASEGGIAGGASNNAEEGDKKAKFEFAFDIKRVPCARDAFLNGIVSGVIAGFVRGFMTLNPIKGGNVAVFTFAGISIVSWHWCRYQRERNIRLIKESIEKLSKRKESPSPSAPAPSSPSSRPPQ
eukprot:Opistho-1_new@102234